MIIFLEIIFIFIFLLIPILVSIAILTLIERKVMGSMQKRRGPNVVGAFGLLQPFADGLKLLLKETILPQASIRFLFFLSPIILFSLNLFLWFLVPFAYNIYIVNVDIGVIFLLSIMSLSVYGVILAGWSSSSKYSIYGSLRSAAQLISYEIPFGLVIIFLCLKGQSFNLISIVNSQQEVWNVVLCFPAFIIFFICCLAETNRTPFDLPEAEAELVAGYNVEYSSLTFALFFLGEYSSILFLSFLNTLFFFGGWNEGFVFFILKFFFFVFLFIWVRATFPRYRYDQLMKLGWKSLIPLSLALLIFGINSIFFLNVLLF
jgi:NADH-quinone oxidoreductase subunit H